MIAFLNALIVATVTASAFTGAKALEKRAPGNYQLHPPSDTYGRCLGVNAPSTGNGATLSVQPCATADFLTVFEFVPQTAGLVRLAGTSFCLDAGLVKLWSCLQEVPQQQWFFTADKHLALFKQTTCVTYSGAGCSRIYCFPGTVPCSSDSWQQWDITEATPPPPPSVKGVTIHPNGNTNLCFVPAGPDVHTQVDGTPVVMRV
ncbi:hypothetical protein QFC21_004903 [Naganishia friedmannii]|uniref:Uncharacterized protein n=1 Tax=Naganishia friedmannii TaxID=89922 RepID=A0ACC2VDK1_9TREE|nr:hypothetical protein QFC21_004903 [Naganishia friedmannii]